MLRMMGVMLDPVSQPSCPCGLPQSYPASVWWLTACLPIAESHVQAGRSLLCRASSEWLCAGLGVRCGSQRAEMLLSLGLLECLPGHHTGSPCPGNLCGSGRHTQRAPLCSFSFMGDCVALRK